MSVPTTRAAKLAQASYKESNEDPGTTEAPESERVYIRVRHAVVLPVQTPSSSTSSANTPLAGHLYLIEGSLDNIKRYAGDTVDWVVKVAQLVCDPLHPGQLYTHTTGTSSHWYTLDRTPEWRQVALGDLLRPGIYEFEPVSSIHLSRISERRNHSKTTKGDEPISTKFRHDIVSRDQACVVTNWASIICIASHLIPKRMGTDGAKAVVERFSGSLDADGVHRFNPKIGILVTSNLDKYVDSYWVGFYHSTGNSYILHNFHSDHNASVMGSGGEPMSNALPRLHLYPVTFTTHDSTVSLPPPGVFDWHYLQCVIGVFACADYRNFPDIKYHVHPFKTSDDWDSGDEWDYEYFDDHPEIEPPYPSYRFDRYVESQWERHGELERNQEVAQWASSIPPSIPSST